MKAKYQKIGSKLIQSSQYNDFLLVKEVRLDMGKFSVTGKIENCHTAISSYELQLYSENEQLKELSDINDYAANEFIEKLLIAVEHAFEKEAERIKQEMEIKAHNRALELIDELT